MAKSRKLGSARSYLDGVAVLGAAPAMASAGTVTPRALRNKCHWTNPDDTRHAYSLLFRFLRTNPAVQQAFDGTASPLRNVAKLNEWRDDVDPNPAGTVVYDYYLVTCDTQGYPLTKTSANALYLGHA